jgi:DNA-binding GntR family transcriptional regulator
VNLPAVPGPVTRSSLRQQVTQNLRAALISGQMRPGRTYSVPGLAESFGVSATPVREAMLDLVKDGLVAAVPNKGFRVVQVSEVELDEVTQLRLLLEVPTVTGLAGNLSTADLAALRDLAEQVRRHAAAADLIAYIETDNRLHLELLGHAGNSRLVALVDDLRARTRLYGLGRLAAEGSLTRSAVEHLELLDALEQGSAERAQALITRHVRHARGIWVGRDEPADPGAGAGR